MYSQHEAKMVHYVESDPTHESRVGSGIPSVQPTMGPSRIIRVNQGGVSLRLLSTHEVRNSPGKPLSTTPLPGTRTQPPSIMEPRRSKSGLQAHTRPTAIKVVTKIISSSASKGPDDPGSRDEAGTQITMDFNQQVEIGQLSIDEFDLPANLAGPRDLEQDVPREVAAEP